ncbi:MAG: hypothetical protein QW117_02290 [Candidatus Pacearchaeota archaeon]
MKKNKNEIIEFFDYLINTLNIPVLRNNKPNFIIERGDFLNVIAQPIKKQLEEIIEKTITEEEMDYIINFGERIKEILEKNNSPYFFYELLNKNFLGIIDNDSILKDYNFYKSEISSIEEEKDIKIVKVKVLNRLENAKNINYIKKGSNLENCSNTSCLVVNSEGKNIEYRIGKEYDVQVTGITKIGNVYVSFITKDLGKTVDNKEVNLKIVYRSYPKRLKFPTNIKIKVKRIINEKDLIKIKAYPSREDLY